MNKFAALICLISITYSVSCAQNTADEKKHHPYLGFAELGYTKGVGINNLNSIKINLVNGVRINPHFSVGIGTGARFFREFETTVVPLFIDSRAYLIDGIVSPFIAFDAGFTFNVIHSFNNIGSLFNLSTGVAFRLENKTLINLGIGYERQDLQLYYNGFAKKYICKGVSFVLGFSF